MKVLVVGGGVSAEREIALLSSKAVFDALIAQNFEAEFYDWDGTTQWLELNLSRFEVVLPILHGAGGEDGQIQKILESHGSKFIGSGSVVAAHCFDKSKTLDALSALSIKTPAGKVVTFDQYKQDRLFSTAHVLKPYDGGSSIDTYIFNKNMPKPLEKIKDSFKTHHTMLLEEYVDGTEITVAILDGTALPVIEICPPKNGVFDYVNKYNGATEEFCPPKHVSEAVQKKAQALAERIYEELGCRHLARIDMIISGEDIYVLEVNTMPGMTDQSLFPKAAAVAGYTFENLVAALVDSGEKEPI